MKKTTLFDYLPDYTNRKEKLQDTNDLNSSSNKRNQQKLSQQKELKKKYQQKNIVQIIKEENELIEIAKNLGESWIKKQGYFGYTNEENIMVFSTIRDFKKNFFETYQYNDFILLNNEITRNNEIIDDKDKFMELNGTEYNSYYLSIALNILGKKLKVYQHKKLKLLFLRNESFGVLICPKF